MNLVSEEEKGGNATTADTKERLEPLLSAEEVENQRKEK